MAQPGHRRPGVGHTQSGTIAWFGNALGGRNSGRPSNVWPIGTRSEGARLASSRRDRSTRQAVGGAAETSARCREPTDDGVPELPLLASRLRLDCVLRPVGLQAARGDPGTPPASRWVTYAPGARQSAPQSTGFQRIGGEGVTALDIARQRAPAASMLGFPLTERRRGGTDRGGATTPQVLKSWSRVPSQCPTNAGLVGCCGGRATTFATVDVVVG